MKKGAILLVAGLLMLTMCAIVSASEVGNITILGEKEGFLKLGLHAEHLTRQMDLKDPATMATGEVNFEFYNSFYIEARGTGYFDLTRLEEIEIIDRYFLKASLKLGPTEVYGKFGTARLISKWEHYNLTFGIGPYYDDEEWYPGYIYFENGYGFYIENPGITIEKPFELGLERSDWGTFYGVGLKLIFSDKPDFKAALDAQYGYQKNKDMGFCSLAVFGDLYDSYAELGMGTRIDESETTEMHLALVLSGIMGKLSPYAGLKFSKMETKYKGQIFSWYQLGSTYPYTEETLFPFEYTMKQTDSFGMFFGTDYHFTEKLTGKFETRLLDETAFSIGLELKV